MGFVSLLPILIAVILALYTRQAVFALFCGLLSAALLLNWETPLHSFVYLIDPLILDAVANKDSMKVVLFSILISSTVEIMRRAGGTQALVGVFIRFAKTRRRALLGTWLSGLVIFFDDYANCLIVGSSMRSVVDRAKISREKLAYLVDSTAAPVATLALISTWIGYEVSLMDTALNQQTTIPHTSAVTAPYSSVFVSDPKHTLEQPSIRINDQSYSLQKQSYGWSAEASTQTTGRWELQITEKNSQYTPLIAQSPWENAAIGLAIQNGKTVLSDIAETDFQNQTPTRIFTEKSDREGLLLKIAHRGNDVLIRDIQNNMFR
ncbi:MAG: hypothetical protein VX278_20540, partial [Myxococcota bacterium]|nr:hypothetical protein [Myxococcota bacterium]